MKKKQSTTYYMSAWIMKRSLLMISMCLVSIFILRVDSASAHSVTIFAWVEGDTIFTESKFSGGRKVKKGKVIVYDKEENRLLEGNTDLNGTFSFKVPKKTTLKIVLKAGTGHLAEWTVTEDEVRGIDNYLSETVQSLEKKSDKSRSATSINTEEIQQAVEKALEKKLSPMIKTLAESQTRGPSFKDVLGGIGYIMGIVGIVAYIQSRKTKSESDKP